MIVDTLAEETNLVIQRLKLDPGEANYWHSDNCLRFSVVVSGSRLAIEYKDSGDINELVYMQAWQVGIIRKIGFTERLTKAVKCTKR